MRHDGPHHTGRSGYDPGVRRIALLLLMLACAAAAGEPPPPWVAANFVGDPPAALMRSREGMLRWVGLWGTRRLQHGSLVSRVAVAPDGKWLASACWDGTARLWEVKTGREIRTLEMGQTVLGLAISPDGRRIYAGDECGEIRAWDAATGSALESRQLDTGIGGLALSLDGRRLAWWGKGGFDVRDAFTLGQLRRFGA
jgi:hypothetical protein